jgi:hypothetical protein
MGPPTKSHVIDEQRERDESHRGRERMRQLRLRLLLLLLKCRSDREHWNILKDLLDKKKRTPLVSLSQMLSTMRTRMNPPLRLPPSFDGLAREEARAYCDSIPPFTADDTPQSFFSRLFTTDDIQLAKLKIRNRRTTPGLDHWTYRMILTVPDEDLLKIMNK